MQETRAKIDPANLKKLQELEQKKQISMQLLGMTIYSFERSKRKVEMEIEKIIFEMEESIKEVAKKNNIDGQAGWILKDIDFKSGEIVIARKNEVENNVK